MVGLTMSGLHPPDPARLRVCRTDMPGDPRSPLHDVETVHMIPPFLLPVSDREPLLTWWFDRLEAGA
jgi:hypothetical protein